LEDLLGRAVRRPVRSAPEAQQRQVAPLVSILGFFLEGDTFIGAVATVLIVVEVLHGRKPADQDR
jgi:hypothetical protein